MSKPLSAKQEKAAIMIGYGESKKNAAIGVGVTPQTISEWLQRPDFEALINQFKRLSMLEAQDRMRGHTIAAVESLYNLMIQAKSEKVQLLAAQYIIEKANLAPNGFGLWPAGPLSAVGVIEEREKLNYPQSTSLSDDLI